MSGDVVSEDLNVLFTLGSCGSGFNVLPPHPDDDITQPIQMF